MEDENDDDEKPARSAKDLTHDSKSQDDDEGKVKIMHKHHRKMIKTEDKDDDVKDEEDEELNRSLAKLRKTREQQEKANEAID